METRPRTIGRLTWQLVFDPNVWFLPVGGATTRERGKPGVWSAACYILCVGVVVYPSPRRPAPAPVTATP